MSRTIDLTGQRFGRLVVLQRVPCKTPNRARWAVLCDCGTQKAANGKELRNGDTSSCGCLHREMVGNQFRTHGGSGSAEFWAFHNAKTRCTNPSGPSYENYGKRGIRFCFDSLEQFILEVGRRPTPEHSLDRIDVNGDYAPGNVRWALPSLQARNKRTNRMLAFRGKTQCITDWAEEIGLSRTCIKHRLKNGWSVDEALGTPPLRLRRKRPLKA